MPAIWQIQDCDYRQLIKQLVYVDACDYGLTALKVATASENWHACQDATLLSWAVQHLPMFYPVNQNVWTKITEAYLIARDLRRTSASNAYWREVDKLDASGSGYAEQVREATEKREAIKTAANTQFLDQVRSLVEFTKGQPYIPF